MSDPANPAARRFVVMGVSGSGKTTVGVALAARLGVPFVEGDDHHPPANVAKMASGTPLTDEDRAGWLDALAAHIGQARAADGGLVMTCSALRRRYRDVLRAADPHVRFVFLEGSPELIAERMAARRGHFMPPTLLASQFTVLEVPDDDEHVLVADVAAPVGAIVEGIVADGQHGARDGLTS